MKPTILCIEGKYSGSPTFSAALEKKGYNVRRESSGKAARDNLKKINPQVVVINAPSMRTTGLRICKSIRQRKKNLPIILICAEGLTYPENEIGVNLILPLPFTIRKLNNRVKPLLPTESDKIIKAGPIYLDKERLLVKCQSKESQLTPKTADLLIMLIDKKGEVLERDHIFSEVWETDFTDDTRTLDVHISWLRQAIEDNPRKPKYLKTLRGIGYRLDV
jgi:DNA-binding response OmpR family regulator